MDFFSLIPAALSVVNAGINAYSGSRANDRATDAAEKGSQEAADILTRSNEEAEGYTLAGLGTGMDLAGERFRTIADILPQAADRYAGSIGDTFGAFGDIVDLGRAEGEADIMAGGQDFDRLVAAGVIDANGRLQPWVDAGDEGLAQLRQISATDPSKLTPAQQLALADLKRSGATRLAAGGLRGAGRAGVAAMNDIETRAQAGFQKQNQDRADLALTRITSAGFAGTGQQAQNEMSAASSRGQNAVRTGQSLAELGSRARGAQAAAATQAGQTIAARDLATDTTLAGEAGGYFDNMAKLAAGGADVRAGTALARGTAQAGAKTSAANLSAQNTLANARLQNGAFAAVTSAIGDEARRRATPSYSQINWNAPPVQPSQFSTPIQATYP